MPRISAFYGISIWMFYDETIHRGRPHFHATYSEHEASIDFTGAVLAGGLSPRALRLVAEWAREHAAELEANWERARRHEPLSPIEPLR